LLASITHLSLCAGTLVVVCVGLAGLLGPGSSPPQEQSRWGGNEVRACGGNGRGVRTAEHVRNEELDGGIYLEIEKVRRTTYRTESSEGSLCCWIPRKCLRGTDRPWQ